MTWSIDLDQPDAITDADLTDAIVVLTAEQRRRAVASADLDALTELGFDQGFDAEGKALDPWIEAGVLVVPGSKRDRSASSHNCRFARVGDRWVWEHPDRLLDTIRSVDGPRRLMRSVTLVPLAEGDKVDVLDSRTRAAVHELVAVRSFSVTAGRLELVDSRAVRVDRHR